MSNVSRFNDARVLIETAFQAGFISAPATPFVPTRYQNVAFKQPAAGVWAEFWIMEGQTGNADVRGNFQRTPGFVCLKIFTPENTGSKTARECADKLAEVFQNANLVDTWGELTFRAVQFQTIGKTQEGWFQHNAICNFWVDVRPMP